MLQLIKGFFVFYRGVIIPAVFISLALAMAISVDGFSVGVISKGYFFIFLILLFVRYQVRYPNEYYFYYNL